MPLIERPVELAVPAPSLISARIAANGLIAFDWDSDGRIASWNDAAQTFLGWSAQEVLGTFPPPFIAPEDVERYRLDCAAVFAGAGAVSRSIAVLVKRGEVLHAIVLLTRSIDTAGSARGLCILENLADRVAGERRLAMLEMVAGNATDAVIVTDAVPIDGADGSIVFVNDAFTRMTGYTAAQAVGRTARMLYGPRTDSVEVERIALAMQRREPVSAELTNYRRDGTEFRVELSISPVLDADGGCLYFIAIERDVTQRRALERYESNRAAVLEMALCNERLDKQLGRTVLMLKDVIPGSFGTIVLLEGDRLTAAAADPDLSPALLAATEGWSVGPCAGSCGTAVYECEAVVCEDIALDDRWADYRAVALAAGIRACWALPMFGANGEVIGAFALYFERQVSPTVPQLQFFIENARFASLVIERNRDRERLERMVLYDALTELPNRKLFETRSAAAMARAQSDATSLAVGILDIDRFKMVNDAFGHYVGDELLRSVALRLKNALRASDFVARMAGDEFLILFADLEDRDGGVAAARQLLAQFESPFGVSGHEMFVRASLGLAFFPQTSTSYSELLQAADEAMYAAKLRGGGLELATVPQAGSALKKLDLENDLRHALGRAEFELYFQLMFDLGNGRPVGAEALLRWNHGTSGRLLPSDFIPVAEANGTIVAIGRWVIEEAVRVARGWQDAGIDAFVTVNVSALQFDEPGLVRSVVRALDRHALEPHRLHLELTESLLMRNSAASATMLVQLKALGVRIVIDDFGTGYSSLAYLQRFSFDALKIDRAFVGSIGDGTANASSERIVAAVVSLGQALGVTTIAEGVEQLAQYAFVKSCGCNVVQGFLCARPVSAADVEWRYWGYPGLDLRRTT